jgi:hypothetical protein
MNKITRQARQLVVWRSIGPGLSMLLVSFILLFVVEANKHLNPLWIGTILPAFVSVIATSGVFAVFYELFVRKQQTDFVLDAIGLKESLMNAGLDNISLNYLDYLRSPPRRRADTLGASTQAAAPSAAGNT